MRSWAIAVIIPAGFLFWRLFIFHNKRPTTDVGLQLSYLFKSPLMTGFWWLVRLFQSTVNIAILPWGEPRFQSLFDLSLSGILIGIFIAGMVALSLLLAFYFIDKIKTEKGDPGSDSGAWQMEAIWIGLAGVVQLCKAQSFRVLLEIIGVGKYLSNGQFFGWMEIDFFIQFIAPESLVITIPIPVSP